MTISADNRTGVPIFAAFRCGAQAGHGANPRCYETVAL
jgi:hypothetical protein